MELTVLLKKSAAVLLSLFLCLGFSGISYAATSGDTQTVNDVFKQKQQDAKKSPSDKKDSNTQSLKNDKQSPIVSGGQTNIFVILIKLVGALAIVILLIYFLYKMVSKKTKAFRDGGAIHTVAGVSVGANRSVQLVKIGEEVLVLGVGENVQLLKEIKDPDLIETLTADKREVVALSGNVKKLINWSKEKTGSSHGHEHATSTSFNKLLSNALKQTKDERAKAVRSLKRKDSEHE